MKDLASILVVLDRSPRDAPLVSKALLLARELNARIELFACDAQYEYALPHASDQRGVEMARQNAVADLYDYLRRLSHSVTAQNVAVTMDVVCKSPLHEGIVHKVFKSCPDLVMKAAGSARSGGRPTLDANDWQLVRTCPVALMLCRGGAWSSRPRFAAAVDVSEGETPGLLERVVRSAAYLSGGCSGELDVVFGECSSADSVSGKSHAAKLRNLARELHLGDDRVWTLTGDPAVTLPAFAARQHSDVVVLGALAHQAHPDTLVGSLTRKLMDTLDCDFLLLRAGRFEFPVRGQIEAAPWRAAPPRKIPAPLTPVAANSYSTSYTALRRGRAPGRPAAAVSLRGVAE